MSRRPERFRFSIRGRRAAKPRLSVTMLYEAESEAEAWQQFRREFPKYPIKEEVIRYAL